MGELGLMGINVSEKYGGSELDALAYAIAMEEISRGCANAGNIMTAHNSLYIHPISKYGTEAQNFEHVTPFVTGILPNSIYSWSIGHILEHEFFCLGHLGCAGSKGKKVDLNFSEQLLRVVLSTF